MKVADDGFAVIDQLYAPPAGAVRADVTVPVLLAQSVDGVAVIEPVGYIVSVVVTAACVRTQPLGVVSVTVTVPVPAATWFQTMLRELAAAAVLSTYPPSHVNEAPLALNAYVLPATGPVTLYVTV